VESDTYCGKETTYGGVSIYGWSHTLYIMETYTITEEEEWIDLGELDTLTLKNKIYHIKERFCKDNSNYSKAIIEALDNVMFHHNCSKA
jgi:hypothetical protein